MRASPTCPSFPLRQHSVSTLVLLYLFIVNLLSRLFKFVSPPQPNNMPPSLSEEVSDEEIADIPFKNGGDKAEDNGGDDADEDVGDEEGVYVVESIKEHQFLGNGKLHLFVRWKGYDDIADHTWEPEENLQEGAEQVLAEYYRSIGGRPEKPAGKAGPGRKRKSMGETKSPSASASAEPKRRRRSTKAQDQVPETEADEDNDSWVPKGKSWDQELDTVDTIIRDQDDGGLYAMLLWKNGKRSRVSIESCYEKCPKKMLKFYESHLVFKDG
ncbi:hypothetical protein PENDEC_c012G01820 [Penicillium decumbens]|uniref:Chromo domain-containing protein n=1 Tax=Penicillium decumbens TaxID=69771 RepID=A0A1V6PBG9_PENDC|nr:hypothetical protein PENDEC_c012G01820 [Penicillium decumbens]